MTVRVMSANHILDEFADATDTSFDDVPSVVDEAEGRSFFAVTWLSPCLRCKITEAVAFYGPFRSIHEAEAFATTC